jgi:O-acetyl-ADP-ribose deacetylase (regulator of RNase III)
MILYTKGDIIKALESGEIDVLAHACNMCAGMGAGIAKQIATKFPNVDEFDKNCINTKTFPTAELIEVFENKYVCNMYVMKYPGKPLYSNDTFVMRMLRVYECLKKLEKTNLKIGMPLILSDLGRSDVFGKGLTPFAYFAQYIAPYIENFNIYVYVL